MTAIDRKTLARARMFMFVNVMCMSVSNIIERVALSSVPPIAVTSIEVWINAIASLVLQWIAVKQGAGDESGESSRAGPPDPETGTKGRPIKARGAELWHFAVAGLCGQVAGSYSFLNSAKSGGIGFTVAIVQTWSLWAILMGILFLRERGDRRLALAVPVALIGIFLISTQGQDLSNVSAYLSSGLLWAFAASLSFATSSVLIRRGLSRGADRRAGFTVQYLTASVVLVVAALVDPTHLVSLSVSKVGLIASAGILAGVLGMGFMYKALAMCPISKVMLINASYPAVVNILSWIFLREMLTAKGIIGILLVTSSCVWAQRYTNDTTTSPQGT
ncbi:MAG: DMT family transporter [Firmicutes bacterium]|nr:DMT family transporter [Bacillota bacterium]